MIGLHDLTDEQRTAVWALGRTVVVTAAAGSGKTRVLTHRVRRLLDDGVDPADVMLCTFTRKAAGEMRLRLRQLVPEAADIVWIGTLHAYALELLQQYGHLIGYRNDVPLSVYGESMAADLLRQVCRDLGFLRTNGKWRAGWSFKRLASAKGALSVPPDGDDGIVFREYFDRLRQSNAVDYDCMIAEATQAVMAAPPNGPSHILVDEAQDLSGVQHRFIHELMQWNCAGANLFMVGDIRQSIYGWRGACPGELLAYQGPRLSLATNFRSCEPIIDAANRLIANNGETYHSDMTADPHHEHEECEPVTVRSGPEPIDVIETALLRLLEDGHDPRDIAILSRTNRMLDTASAVCLNMDLPFQRIARRRDAEDTDPAFAASLAALQLVVNPYDHNAFRRVCEWCGIPEATIAEALEAALVESTEAVSELLERTKAISVADNAQDLLRWVGNCHPDEEFGTAAWMALLAAFGDEVASAWEAMGYRTPQTALRGYMMRDRDLVDELDGEGVTLATIHAAKGLEWPAVIVIGMDEGHFPRKGCDDAALIEERCCAYVAMTRARRKLVLLSCGEVPSRFIREALP